LNSAQLSVSIVSDVVCPWCYIGKRRFEKALLAVNGEVNPKITWQPFELNPQMPRAGIDRKAYRIAKFGSWAASQAMDARVAEAGAGEGITFNFDAMTKTPNTFDAHRLIWFAAEAGKQSEVVEQLFYGYFVEGSDVGGRKTLLRIAELCGLPAGATRSFLEFDAGTKEVARAARRAQESGISGVPTFIINETHVITGAQSTDVFRAAFAQAVAAESSRS
jgi:predicted DsbA family dithiol-disulfide isomerase